MKKKRAQARKPSPRKIRPATAAPSPSGDTAPPPHPPVPPEPRDPGDPGGDETLSIAAMLRAQVEATHLAAMDCLHRARTAESPELCDRALTHATRLLSLFTRQVNALERRRPAAAAPRTESRTASGADSVEQRLADSTAKALSDAAAAIPAVDAAGVAALAARDGLTPAGYNGAGGGAGSGP